MDDLEPCWPDRECYIIALAGPFAQHRISFLKDQGADGGRWGLYSGSADIVTAGRETAELGDLEEKEGSFSV